MESVLDQLKRARKLTRVNQTRVARAMGYDGPSSHSNVSNIEKGRQRLYLDQAEAWADVCGYDILIVPRGASADRLTQVASGLRPQNLDLLARLAYVIDRAPVGWTDSLRDMVEGLERRLSGDPTSKERHNH